MPSTAKSKLRFSLPLMLAAFYLMTMGVISHTASAQCNRPGFKLNFGYFSTSANKAVTADFNADGKQDIATMSSSGGKVAVYFGDGTGGFGAPAIYLLGNFYKLIAAEMNNDGKPDLVMVNISGTNVTVTVLLNNGTGVFGSPISASFPLEAQSLQVADFNGDGKGDLAYMLFSPANSVNIRFGDGVGNFTGPFSYPLASSYEFVVGDFNGDSKRDVALLNGDNAGRQVTLYLNNGSGGLVAGMSTTLGTNSDITLARDFNSDGKLDIAGYTQSPNSVMTLLNNGDGSFTRKDSPVLSTVAGIHDGDFNGDGKVDLITTGYNSPVPTANSSTLYGDGVGGFTRNDSFGPVFGWVDVGDASDFNGDGKTDVVVATGMGVRAFLRTCNDVSNTKRVDYDGDGGADFAVWRPSTGNWIITQTYTNTLRTQKWGGGSFGDVPVPGDYDGDGKSDLAVFRAPAGAWYVLRSSDNTFYGVQWGVSTDKPVPGDYDGDGKTDIAVFRQSDGGWYILQSSNSMFSTFVFGTNGDKPAQADFDNDDKTDVAVFRPSNGYWYILKSSDGSFAAVPFGTNGDKPAPADYDGDGKADIAVYRPGIAFYFLNSWNNSVTALADNVFTGTYSAGNLPAPIKRGDTATPYIWRNSFYGGLNNTASAPIGTSGDIPVVAPYVIE